ncbi:hypothetical protein EDB84DRAFT_1563232 [Lactarius hengduanensis]|nr:hypothetical protein EDB84DRAFT_1563232 [Lactarius hengduanensis]
MSSPSLHNLPVSAPSPWNCASSQFSTALANVWSSRTLIELDYHMRAALAPDVHKTPSAVPPHKTKKDECRSIQVYALTSVVDEDDQDCGSDAKTIKDHGGDDDDDEEEDNQDDHGGDDDDDAKTITAAVTTAKTIKTTIRRRRRREGDHGDNDNNAKAITAVVMTATTIKTAAAKQR